MKMKKERDLWLISVMLLIQVVITLLDIKNIPSCIGMSMSAINWELQSIFITIILFLITFFVINRRDIRQQKYQKNVAGHTLYCIYSSCKEMVELLDNPEVLARAVGRCNLDLPIWKDEAMQKIINKPFRYESIIVESSINGTISENDFKMYLKVRNEYEDYIVSKIIYHDKDKCKNQIKKKEEELLSCINKEILKYGDQKEAKNPLQ